MPCTIDISKISYESIVIKHYYASFVISTYAVPPSTPQILVQQKVNSYQISLRGPGDDTFGAPRLGDHFSNQPYLTSKDASQNGWTPSHEQPKKSKKFSSLYQKCNKIDLKYITKAKPTLNYLGIFKFLVHCKTKM